MVSVWRYDREGRPQGWHERAIFQIGFNHLMDCERGGCASVQPKRISDNLAEIIIIRTKTVSARMPGRTTLHCSAEFRVVRPMDVDPVLSLVVWTLKREVRAIRGCLGTYRR